MIWFDLILYRAKLRGFSPGCMNHDLNVRFPACRWLEDVCLIFTQPGEEPLCIALCLCILKPREWRNFIIVSTSISPKSFSIPVDAEDVSAVVGREWLGDGERRGGGRRRRVQLPQPLDVRLLDRLHAAPAINHESYDRGCVDIHSTYLPSRNLEPILLCGLAK